MPEHLRGQILIHVILVIFGHIGVPRLLPGDKRAVSHVVHLFQLALQPSGPALRQRVVYKGHHGVLPLQVRQILVGIVGHQRKRAHDQQAGHRNADGREGHEAMGEHIAGAFFEKVTEIFHCGATPSYVPVASPTTRPLSR